jgi:hypothetical protein
MPQEVLRRIYLKTGSLQLEEKGDKDPNSAVVTYVRSSPPFNAPTVGFLSNAVRRLVGALNAEGVLALLHRATPSARSAMALDFEAVAIKLIAEGKTFRITALPVAVKLKGSKSGTRGACTSGGGKKRGGGEVFRPIQSVLLGCRRMGCWFVRGVVALAPYM